jgi:hypothetical protein
MLIQLLHFVVMWLNNFPLATGISTQLSPQELIIRHRLDYKKHCKAPFGAYCKAHKENNPTNSMLTRGTPSICLGPTGNLQGSYHFLSLMTGKLIKCRHFTEIPIPQAVINRVAHFAKNSPSPDLIFTNRHCQPYDWLDTEIIGSDTPPMAPYPDIPDNMPGVQLERKHSSSSPPPSVTPSPPDDPDWAQLADEALANADIDHMDVLPDPLEVIIIDNDDDTPLPPPVKQTLQYLPKIEQGSILPSSSQPSHCYPTCIRTPPKHFGFDHDHIFTTMADDVQTSYPYIDASGKTIDLAFEDEITFARICHYVMLHCAESSFLGNPNNKKQYGLKAGLK